MGKSKRLTLFIAIIMLITLICPAVFAAADTAANMELTKITGSVQITDGAGKAITARESMRLYNGYNVGTAKKSYAWVNLDSQKLVKLDAASKAGIKESSRKLKIYLEEGRIYFNVAKPLENNESLEIRTSNTITSIRGTCGWVDLISRDKVSVNILEGTVSVTVTDPVTGRSQTEAVTGGETALLSVYGDNSTEKTDIEIGRIKRRDIPGFVLTAVTSTPGLAQKIFDNADLKIDLRYVTGEQANERQTADEDGTFESAADTVGKQIFDTLSGSSTNTQSYGASSLYDSTAGAVTAFAQDIIQPAITAPAVLPTATPTAIESNPTVTPAPTAKPAASPKPTATPTTKPKPSAKPSATPTTKPSASAKPSATPTIAPSASPSASPSATQSVEAAPPTQPTQSSQITSSPEPGVTPTPSWGVISVSGPVSAIDGSGAEVDMNYTTINGATAGYEGVYVSAVSHLQSEPLSRLTGIYKTIPVEGNPPFTVRFPIDSSDAIKTTKLYVYQNGSWTEMATTNASKSGASCEVSGEDIIAVVAIY